MGSYSTLIWQCAVLVALFAVLVWVSPEAAKVWVVVAGVVALTFFVTVSIMRHRQIKRLSAEIDSVLHGGRSVKFEKCREGDVAVLSNELEKMVARLSRITDQLEKERNSLSDALADISHQIRTPMTAAELMLASIECTEDPIERKQLIRRLENMLERISWLVTTLLKIAKADADTMHVESKPVLVRDAVKRAVAPLEASLDLRDISLETKIDPAASFVGDEVWTAEALENIVKNCMEHTPPGGTISVSASENALGTTIKVHDTGAGIADEDLPHIFERFYRGKRDNGESRMADPEGFGIGLALAQALISAQGGTLRASNCETGGARFQISFFKVIV